MIAVINAAAIGVAVFLGLYLSMALLRPEWFQ